MREFLLKLFSTTDGSAEIALFNFWHILYWLIIVGGSIGAAFLLKGKTQKTKEKTLRILAWVLPSLYIADFLIMPLARTDFTIDVDKLPFHICTLLSFFVPFAQFNKKFEKIKDAIACLAIVSSLMYLTYPGAAVGDLTPWCYRILQTFLYHGVLFAWGFLSVATGEITLDFKTIWKPLVGIAMIIVWALYGSTVYSNADHHYDWFFVTGSTFPFIPAPLMPFAVFFAVGGMCAIIHAIDLGVKKYLAKKSAVQALENTNENESESVETLVAIADSEKTEE